MDQQSAMEIHVVAAPTEAFFTRVALLAASIRLNARAHAQAPIIVTLSRDVEPYDVAAEQRWSRELGVEWRWVDEQVWAEHDMYGSALARMSHGFDAPFVVLLDADTVCTGPLDELPALVGDGFGGVIAHVSPAGFAIPWFDGEARRGEQFWAELFARVELDPPALLNQVTGWLINDFDPERRWCPPYCNLGMLAAPADVMSRVGAVVFDEMRRINEVVETGFRCQLAVMTAIERTATPFVDQPTSWNFPNDPTFQVRYPRAAQDARILHYLRPGEFERERDSVSLAAVDAFVQRPMAQPPNELLRRTFASARAALRQLDAQPTIGRAAHG
jgi:hypothetical protein